METSRTCRTNADCQQQQEQGEGAGASLCVVPSLENQTRLIRVRHPPHPDMLFVGYPSHLQYSGEHHLVGQADYADSFFQDNLHFCNTRLVS